MIARFNPRSEDLSVCRLAQSVRIYRALRALARITDDHMIKHLDFEELPGLDEISSHLDVSFRRWPLAKLTSVGFRQTGRFWTTLFV